MVPLPWQADGAGSQAAPSAALGPALLAAQEAAAQGQPDFCACHWPWLWPQAGLGECVQMSSQSCLGALGAGALAASWPRLSGGCPGPALAILGD